MRRRLYLMRHAAVAYFDADGTPFQPRDVQLTERGHVQAEAARDALAGIELDVVVTSGLPRTLETAPTVAPGHEPEEWPEFREWVGGRLDERAWGASGPAFGRGSRG